MPVRISSVEQAQPDNFAECLELIRENYGCTNWIGFCQKLEQETGVMIGIGTLQHLSPRYGRSGAPAMEVLWALEAAGVLRLGNGQPVTAAALFDIYFGKADANGNPIKANSGKG
jgi:hypothetical protein